MRVRREPHRAVNLPLYPSDRAALLEAARESGRSPTEIISDAVTRALSCGQVPPRNFGDGDQFLYIELPASLVTEIRVRRRKVVHFIRWAINRQLVAIS